MKKSIIVFLIGIIIGVWITQKDTFTNQDIEHILYNTPLNN